MPSTVALREVHKAFGDVAVIQGITMQIGAGEFVVMVGPSGCGKSTLLRMIAGLEGVTSGEIAIGGRVVNRVEPKDRNIAMVFQNYALYPHMSVYQNMAYGLKIRRVPKAEIEARVRKAAETLELHRLETTTLYVTHDQVEAMTLAERMLVMNAGRAEQIGAPDEVYSRPATTFVAGFIGSPPMNLIPGRVEAGGATLACAGGAPARLARAVPELAGREVLLGVRPEHLDACGAGEAMLTPQVDFVELLGSDLLVYGNLAAPGPRVAARVAARLHASLKGRRSAVPLRYEAEHMHLFDPESGRRIEDREEGGLSPGGQPTVCAIAPVATAE
jgi:sn-glycerol 3-phosphate transport system ATP-binding protein